MSGVSRYQGDVRGPHPFEPFVPEYVGVLIGIWLLQMRPNSVRRPVCGASSRFLGNPSPPLPLWPRSWALEVFAQQKVEIHALSKQAHKTAPALHSLQGARHAVSRTLYSRAHRIVLDGTSSLLSSLCKRLSFDLFLAVVIRVLVCPALELLVLAKQKFECLGNDVGRRSVNKLGIEF